MGGPGTNVMLPVRSLSFDARRHCFLKVCTFGSDHWGAGLRAGPRLAPRTRWRRRRNDSALVKNRVCNQWDVSLRHDGSGRDHARRFTSWARGVWRWLPKGSTLPDQVWAHRHRAILVLRLWEELSYAEIARVLGISLPAVKMRLSRAREQFRKFYEEEL